MTLLRLHFLVHKQLVHLDKSSLQTFRIDKDNSSRHRCRIALGGVKNYSDRPSPQQVLHAAKESVSAYPTIEIDTTDMSSATANAAISPFLKLPPELRRRIYDYVFGSNLVQIMVHPHVEHNAKRVDYQISSCTCETYDTRWSPRVCQYEHETELAGVLQEDCQDCTASLARQASATQVYGLSLLQVCRQIYHEAALKTFQQGVFIYDFDEDCNKRKGLQAFVNALAPIQINSIKRLQLWCPRPASLKSTKRVKLKGLRHLMIRLDFRIRRSDRVLPLLESFVGDPTFLRLAQLNLKTCRLDLRLHTPGRFVREAAALLGDTLKITTAKHAEVLEDILKRTEAALLQAAG